MKVEINLNNKEIIIPIGSVKKMLQSKRIYVKGTSKRKAHWRTVKVGTTEESSPLTRIKAIVPNVHLDGATSDQLNSIAEGIEETIGKFPDVEVDSIGWATDIDDQSYGLPDAAYLPQNRGNPKPRIILRKEVATNVTEWTNKSIKKFNARKESNIEYYNDMIKGYESWDDYPEEVKKYKGMLDDINVCSRLFIATESEDKLKGIMIHECYHAIDEQMKLENIFLEQLKKAGVTKRDQMVVSDYASSKETELWAETGLAMILGIDIPDSIKEAFKNTMETIQ